MRLERVGRIMIRRESTKWRVTPSAPTRPTPLLLGPISALCLRPRTKGTLMTDREKILTALREKPLKAFEIMKRVNIRNQDDCQSLLLKMRDDGVVKFDIHKGHWLAA
jgi:hypothetical protein